MSATNTDDSHTSFLSRVIKNALWMFNSSIFVRLFNLIKGIVLARLLVPDDFGLFGLSMVVIGFVEMFSDVGAGVSLIYKQKEVNEKYIHSAFWINTLISTVLAFGIIVASPFITAFYGRGDLLPVLLVMAVALWFQVLSNVHRSILRRDLQFKTISFVEIFVSFVSLIIAIVMGLAGYGVWALVGSILAGNFLNLILFCVTAKWMPKFIIDFDSVKKLTPFSGNYLGQAIAWYFVFSMGSLLVGKSLGMADLGLYTIATNYSLMVITIVANPLGNVSFPEFARVLDKPDEFWSLYFKVSKLLIGYVSPMVCVLYVIAPDLFPLLFGAKWNGAVAPFQILLIYSLVRCLWVDPFTALGKFGLSMIVGIITALIAFFIMLFSMRFGIVGISMVVLIVIGFSHVISLYVASKSLSKFFEGFKNAFPHVVVSLIAAVLAYFVRDFVLINVTDRKELLILLPVVIVFLVYGGLFFKDLSRLFVSLQRKT